MNIKHKTFKGEIKQLDEKGSFEAVIATLNVVDSDGDIIVPGAFQNATVSVLPAHDHRHVPLGKAKMEDRGDKAVAVGQFNLDVPAAKDWHSALKFDLDNGPAIQEWSFAFRILDSEIETRDGEEIRVLKKLDTMEVSPVLRGAGVETGTIGAKSTKLEKQFDEVMDELDDLIGRWANIVKMRAGKDKPKQLSKAHRERIEAVRAKFDELDAAIKAACKNTDGLEMGALASSLKAQSERLGVDIAD